MTIQPNAPYMVEFLGTPEAGKTSLIKRLNEEISNTLSVGVIQESAELVPDIIPKGSIEAHFWMKYLTLSKLLEAKFSSEYDIVLVDRGIIDSLMWNQYYYTTKMISKETFEYCNGFFTHSKVPYPDQVFYLTTTPRESIKRRGGEGRIVTLEFIRDFNNIVDSFMKQVNYPFFKLDTTLLSKEEKFDIVFKELSRNFHLP